MGDKIAGSDFEQLQLARRAEGKDARSKKRSVHGQYMSISSPFLTPYRQAQQF